VRYCFAVPVRDKAKYLRRTVRAVLRQDSQPLEIIFSDQESTDGSWEILKEEVTGYTGPHKVRLLRCPETSVRGMPGLNEHLNWIHNQTDAEVFISSAADDVPMPLRARKTIEAFEKFKPSMVITGMYFANPDGSYHGETGFPTEDGWVKVEDVYTKYVGGSTTQAWSREFYEKIGGLQGVGSPDMVLPFLAILHKGAYYLNERLHTYCKTVDENNTGLEGVYAAAKDDNEKLALEELMHFQVLAGIFTAGLKMQEANLITADANNALVEQILDRSSSWQNTRQKMSLLKVQPRMFKT
jgi:glycosyltransferase involved in cell wall biosynthesis